MPDLIITPGSGKLEFVDSSAQVTRRHSFTLDANNGIVLDSPFSASSVTAPLNVINVTAASSNFSYPFIFADSGETGPKSLLMDSAGGTYNPSTNTATIDITGNSATTTLASNSTNLGGVAAASYVTLTGTQTLTNKTITGTFTGNLTGTGSWATNAVNANTATNATQLNGQAASYYTNIPARLGYTPVNQAGDTISGNLIVNGNFAVNGSVTAFSASNIYITSSTLTVTDNILLMNALSPYQRYAGIQMYDSGSGTLSQFLWDGEGDYFFLSGSSVNGKIITGPDGQTNLTSNYIPKATAGYKLGNSLIYDNGTNIGIGTTSPDALLNVVGGHIHVGNATAFDNPASWNRTILIDGTNHARLRVRATALVSGNNNVNEAYLWVDNSVAPYSGLYAGYGFKLETGNSTHITLFPSSGNVGIGVSSPTTALHVSGVISGSSFSGAGTGLTGTAAGLSIGGSAASSTTAGSATTVTGTNGQLLTKDVRTIAPNNIANGYFQFGFTSWTNNNNSPYADYLHLRSYTDSSGGNDNLVMFRKDAIGMRIWQQTFGSASNYSTYKDVAFTDQIGNGTITIAAGTGVGVGTTNTFTTNQSGATTVTITNTGVTSNVAGTGISVSGATGAVTITNSGVTSAVAGTGVGVSGATGAVTFSIGQAVGTGNSPTFAAVTTSTDGANHIMAGTTNAEGIRMTPASSTTYPVFLRSINPGVGEASPWIYKEQATDWGIWHNNPVNSIDFTKNGSAGIASNVGGSSSNTVTVRVEMATGFVQTIAGYRNSAGTTILDNNGNITGNAATVTTNANLTGDVTSTGNATTIASNAVTTTKIANSNVTLAKIENITAYTILGNSNASAAATPAALSVATVATMLSGQTMNIAGSSTSCTGNAATATTATTANALNTSNNYTVVSLTATSEVGTRGSNIGVNLERGDSTIATLRFDADNFRIWGGGTGGIGEILRVTETGNIGIGTTSPNAKVESYFSSNALTINYLATNLNNNSPIPVYGFDVTNGSGETRSIKAGIGYERHLVNGRGTLHFYNDSTNDTQSLSGNRTSAGDIKMSIDNDGNVGIGTPTPTYKLQVQGSFYVNSTAYINGALTVDDNLNLTAGNDFIITDSDGTGTYNFFMDSGVGYIRIDDGGSANGKLNINSGLLYVGASGGNVGINTTSPSALLNVRASTPTGTGTITTGTNILIDSNTNNYITFRNTADNGTYAGLVFLDNNVGGYIAFGNAGAAVGSDSMIYGAYQDHIFQNNYVNETLFNRTETMRIKQSGNVGIGTSNPGRKLDVEGIVRTRGASGTGGFEISAATTGTAKWRIEWDSASDSLDFNWVG